MVFALHGCRVGRTFGKDKVRSVLPAGETASEVRLIFVQEANAVPVPLSRRLLASDAFEQQVWWAVAVPQRAKSLCKFGLSRKWSLIALPGV
jgi:hypothetical protein